MKGRMLAGLWSSMAALALAAPSAAVTLGYVEDFGADAAGWTAATFGALSWNASGGPDAGSYVATTLGSINNPGTIQFRTNGSASSGGNFAGDWLGAGVSAISAQVFHDATAPLSFFFRITTGSNSPGIVGIVPVPVLPNTWTPISFTISPSNPLMVIEGPPSFFNTVFGNLTQVQVGVSAPLGLENVPFTYGLDKVTVAPVPEPGTGASLALGLALLAWRQRAMRG